MSRTNTIHSMNTIEGVHSMNNIEVEDSVIRNMGGIEMTLKVTRITYTKIICGAWKFNRKTGGEIDKDLGWDGITKTGSILTGKVGGYSISL